MKFVSDIAISASTIDVWKVLQDVERWPEWTASIQQIERLDDGPLGVGSKVRIRQPNLPAGVWTITEWVPNKGFTWVSRGLGFSATAEHWIRVYGNGSRFAQELRFSGLVGVAIAVASRSLTKRYLDLEAAGLKQKSELPEIGATPT